MSKSFPPRHIAILGAIGIWLGASSVVSMLLKWFSGMAFFDIGFIAIIIGYGLLIGRGSSRRWALIWSGLIWLVLTGLGGWVLYEFFLNHGKISSDFSNFDRFAIVMGWFVSLYFWIILKGKSHRDWFTAIQEVTSVQKSFAWAIAVVSLLTSLIYEANTWNTYETQKKMYPYHITITPYDEVTGASLDSVEHRSGTHYSSREREFKFPTLRFGSKYGKDGMAISIEGIATDPFEYTIYSEGYQNETIMIDRNSPDNIRVPMKREEPKKAE